MNKSTALLVLIGLILAQFNEISSLKCKIGYGISSGNSRDNVKYYYDSISDGTDCGYSSDLNPAAQPIGCERVSYILSGGNTYVRLGCFYGSSTSLAGGLNYDSKVYQHVCTSDNCNNSNNMKISLLSLSALVAISLAKYFKF